MTRIYNWQSIPGIRAWMVFYGDLLVEFCNTEDSARYWAAVYQDLWS